MASMAKHHCSSVALLRPFVDEALQRPALMLFTHQQQISSFSTSAVRTARARKVWKNGNLARGESALHGRFRSGLKMGKIDFPEPVLDPRKRSKVQTADDHGLWDFFDSKKSPLLTPETLSSYGRAWTVSELRKKNFEDLWKLYWQCVKETNRVATSENERERMKAGYGQSEAEDRMREITKTQKAIRHTLTERWYQFETAREDAMQDGEVNLYAKGGESAYQPMQDDARPIEQPAGQA